jgi:putative flavoprotein involved in K+ transport
LPVRKTTVVIIGAGHAGLAMSRCLALQGIDHVVLERGEVANSWRTERWESLTLLTPNWMSRLPDYCCTDDPDGFMGVSGVVSFIERYATSIQAPVIRHCAVRKVRADDDGYRVSAECGTWHCRCLVVASGSCNIPVVPKVADEIPPGIFTIDAGAYRRPSQLPDGPVLVVGASATGSQLAEEIHLSGRDVTLCVGEHIRAPRIYRGRDLFWWMDSCGLQDERYDEVDDINRARTVPSLQLVGSKNRKMLDLNALTDLGVKLVGRLTGIRDGMALFSGSLRNQCALSDLKMNRLLNTIDEWAAGQSLEADVPPPHRFGPTAVPDNPPLMLDLAAEGFLSVVWATGFRPDYSWLDVPVVDRKGRLRHDGGVVEAPGMYLMGQQFLRRRKSSLIDGAADDARDLSAHLVNYLDTVSAR